MFRHVHRSMVEWGACDIQGWQMVDTGAVFRVPVSFGDRIAIASRFMRFGPSSFDVEHVLTRQEVVCGSATEVRVWSKRSERGAVAAPRRDRLRSALETPARDQDIAAV